ncbi:hypothetical protein QUF56_17465 [Ureibacillus composti]|nr:hypothetical protein [Ureibacillus composti]
MKYIGYVANDIQFARLRQKDRDQGLVFIDMYDLPNTDLSAYVGLIITNYVDEDFMMAHKRLFEDYLNKGGVIFSFAKMSQSYLPNAPIWYRSPIAIREREIILREPIATMFEGIDPYDLNYRRGVKGFFTRGYFKELPDGAEVIVEDQLGAPIIYVDRASTNGTLFVGSGTDLYQVYRDEESSANRLPRQILDTIREEYASRKEAHV